MIWMQLGPLFCALAQYDGCASWNVELQPSLLVLGIEWVMKGEVLDRVVGQTVAAIDGIIGVEHGTVTSLQHSEAIIAKALRRIEIEDE